MGHELVGKRHRQNAKAMRREMTDAELKLWNELRAHRLMNLAFRRQVPIGSYIADFACPSHRLIVEVDGIHHAEDATAERDAARSEYLAKQGWTLLRFWNADVIRDIDGICQHIVTVAGISAADATMQASAPQEQAHP